MGVAFQGVSLPELAKDGAASASPTWAPRITMAVQSFPESTGSTNEQCDQMAV